VLAGVLAVDGVVVVAEAVAALLRVVGLSFGLDPELPHDALPGAGPEPFFPLTPEEWPLSGTTELRDGGSDRFPFVAAAPISKSNSVSSA